MNREAALDLATRNSQPFDLVVIGGGATGSGIALDAASRKLRVLLLEKDDFGTGTSSRSTKIIHGGVRYLAQGRIGLVREALHERSLLLRNAPHLVAPLGFVVPTENAYEQAKYYTGLKIYDLLARQRRVKSCSWIDRQTLLATQQNLHEDKFRGGMRYFDAQFDDARLLINIVETAESHGACLLNYAQVVTLDKNAAGRICGVTFRDRESNAYHEITATAVVNATGAGSDAIVQLDEKTHPSMIAPSQGTHIVVSREFLSGDDALLMPRTPDGRVMFAIPWLNHLLIGTTDTPIEQPIYDPQPMEEEIDLILGVCQNYLARAPERRDVLSAFAGVRPLVRPHSQAHTSKVSREHEIDVMQSGLVNISGGKWTTYRLMASQCVDTVARSHDLSCMPSRTEHVRFTSAPSEDTANPRFAAYGVHAESLTNLIADDPSLAEPLYDELDYTSAHCVWAIRHEMARTIEDVLARRTRALFLNAVAARSAAAKVGDILRRELGLNDEQVQHQLASFTKTANDYTIS